MLSRRTSLKSAVTALGVGAVMALSTSTPAFASNEGDHWMQTPNCTADQEIQLQYVNGGWHDQQEVDPTRTMPAGCVFFLSDNGKTVWASSGAGSGWWYDGPDHNMCAWITDYLTYPNVTVSNGVCN